MEILLASGACVLIWFSLWLPSAAHCGRLREKRIVAEMLESMENGGPVRLDDLVDVLWCGRGLNREDVLDALRELEGEGRAERRRPMNPNAGREHLIPNLRVPDPPETWIYIRR